MPFYGFNQFTGRLKNSTNLQPLYPISPVPLERGDPPKMIWDSVKTQAVKVEPPKSVDTTSTLPPKLAAKMRHFQQPGFMEKPVYLMGGPMDKVLFGFTIALGVAGVISCADFVWRSIHKK